MAQSIEQRVLQAVKYDDARAFDALAESAQIGAFRLGRFPVLSLLYLYNARKILSAHEREFIGISSYKKAAEPSELMRKFSGVAGKCLRLYHDEVVSPLEMLLLLDKTARLKRVYGDAAKTDEIKARLQSIYSIKYALGVRFDGGEIIIDKRPLSYREKKRIMTASLCAALGVAAVVCVPTITVALMPKTVAGEVYKLGDIDFASQKQYVLKRDIVLSEAVEEMNCSISGNGCKLIFDGNGAIGTLNGALTDVTIESSGGAVFGTVSSSARIADVTINVEADVTSAESAALVATVNYGAFDGVTVNVKGSVKATVSDGENAAELTFGGMVLNNGYVLNEKTGAYDFGVIENCTVNYSLFELSGAASANAAFGGIAGFNNAYLRNCVVTGVIAADTFDVAGVCAVNSGVLTDSVNRANISQTSADVGWNPIVCGIVIDNYYTIENCDNVGRISAASSGEKSDNAYAAAAAGIAYINRNPNSVPYIVNCVNTGDVESSAANGNAIAAGVCTSSNGGIERCTNSGIIGADAGSGCEAYVGGIADYAYGYIYKSTNNGGVSASVDGTVYAGGISALARAQHLYCVSSGDVSATARNVCAGGIFGVSEIDNYGQGTAEYCISENRLDVSVVGSGSAYVGGIVGYVKEQQFTVSGGKAYLGGGVTNSCFAGTCAKSGVYFGNIAGVCGANIYTSNSYYSNGVEYRNFDGNYYVNNAFTAFGATLSSSALGGIIENVPDKGATSLSAEGVANTETYKTILSELEKS